MFYISVHTNLRNHYCGSLHLKDEDKEKKMADDDLEAIRARRMAELQNQYGGPGGGPSQEEAEQKQRQAVEMKNSILSQVLDQSARARLNTIAVAKADKAQMVENMLIQMARTGQIQQKLTEDQLISLLSRVSEQTQKKTTVKFDRRRFQIDSDED
ncbi:programmed cell death protein 5-like [Gigantopelta aegis]|uniref:programmed cell death protein 5-like n=1 Tax=Gigantopelta aegis TaxID=1735272 RepID=UPI001B88BC0F|nr:programmed cell death protein 5-like [Gigantopelta aegis]